MCLVSLVSRESIIKIHSASNSDRIINIHRKTQARTHAPWKTNVANESTHLEMQDDGPYKSER